MNLTIDILSDSDFSLLATKPNFCLLSHNSQTFIESFCSLPESLSSETPRILFISLQLHTLCTLPFSSYKHRGSGSNISIPTHLDTLVSYILNLPIYTSIVLSEISPLFRDPHSGRVLYLDQHFNYSYSDVLLFNAYIYDLSLRYSNLFYMPTSDLISISDERSSKHYFSYNHKLSHYNFTAFVSRLQTLCNRISLYKQPKVIALDLDNTLWGGIIREDGPLNLKISGHTSVDNYYRFFQNHIKCLRKQGYLLVIVSKNSLDDVLSIFSTLSMPLTESDFIYVSASDQPKSVQLSKLSNDLSISIDQFIFFDDNLFECNEVTSQYPDLFSVPLAPNIYSRVFNLLQDPFLTLSPSSTDISDRTSLYKKRKLLKDDLAQSQNHSASYTSWLSSLQQELDIVLENHMTDRIHTLFNRTNQFNLSMRRLSPSDLENGRHSLYSISLRDKFSSEGTIAALVLIASGTHCTITDFVLSCRVLNRYVEYAVLYSIVSNLDFSSFACNLVHCERNSSAIAFVKDITTQDNYVDVKRLQEKLSNVMFKVSFS